MIASYLWYSLIVSACAACVALVVEPMLRAARRPTRWLWVGTFAVSIVMPALVAVRPRGALSGASPGGFALPDATIAVAAPVATVSLDMWLGVAWIVAALLVGALLLVGLVQLSRARRGAERGILAGREVALTTDLGPGALPFGEPKILVPHWASSLPAEAARLLVAHEDEHVRAGDARLLVGAAIVLAAMPWNVVLWWSLRRLRTAIELDCDARVLRRESSIAPYAELLLQVAGRGRAAPALLALTDSTSQLKTRIDAMTVARAITPFRRAVLGAIAATALVVACETRRPDPIAPVTDNAELVEESSVRLSEPKVEAPATGSKATKLVIVRNATGKLLFSGRLDTAMVLKEIPPSEISSVDVIGQRATPSAEEREGLVTVILKPDATWGTAADTFVHYKSPAPERAPVTGEPRPVTLRDAGFATPPDVILEDASGRVLHVGRADANLKEGFGPYRFSPNDIASVNVDKSGGRPGLITIRMKADARLERR